MRNLEICKKCKAFLSNTYTYTYANDDEEKEDTEYNCALAGIGLRGFLIEWQSKTEFVNDQPPSNCILKLEQAVLIQKGKLK